MAGLEEVIENPRTGVDSGSGHEDERDSINRRRRKRSGKRRGSSGSPDLARAPPSGHTSEEKQKERMSGGQNVQQRVDSEKQAITLTQEDSRTRFYEKYRKEAKEYDRDFLKRYEEDLDTTLIFFSSVQNV